MSSLKDFVDFTYSLVNMEEVEEGKFPKPKQIVFELSNEEHEKIQYAVHQQKSDGTEFKSEKEFYVEVFDVELKFTKKV
jgi:hypothetical protein